MSFKINLSGCLEIKTQVWAEQSKNKMIPLGKDVFLASKPEARASLAANAYTVYIPSSNTFTTSGDVFFPKEDDYLDLLVD
jgi:hypothetical protein